MVSPTVKPPSEQFACNYSVLGGENDVSCVVHDHYRSIDRSPDLNPCSSMMRERKIWNLLHAMRRENSTETVLDFCWLWPCWRRHTRKNVRTYLAFVWVVKKVPPCPWSAGSIKRPLPFWKAPIRKDLLRRRYVPRLRCAFSPACTPKQAWNVSTFVVKMPSKPLYKYGILPFKLSYAPGVRREVSSSRCSTSWSGVVVSLCVSICPVRWWWRELRSRRAAWEATTPQPRPRGRGRPASRRRNAEELSTGSWNSAAASAVLLLHKRLLAGT